MVSIIYGITAVIALALVIGYLVFFKKKDTSYNDHQVLGYSQADFDYSWYYCYYVRNTPKLVIIINTRRKFLYKRKY